MSERNIVKVSVFSVLEVRRWSIHGMKLFFLHIPHTLVIVNWEIWGPNTLNSLSSVVCIILLKKTSGIKEYFLHREIRVLQ